MGRAKLKTLKSTTLKTFFELTKKLELNDQFRYNDQKSEILWNNGSEIVLKDLFAYPSDPDFDELGSLEITGAFIDEISQIIRKAWQLTKSRIRYKLKEHNLKPKILGTCNPSQSWVYADFYKPWSEKKLSESKKFVRSLPDDNPHLPPDYLDMLLSLDENTKQRLYYGNWDYSDDPSKLCEYDSIIDIFTNDHVLPGRRYISADLAMQGRDKFIAGVWDGLICTIGIDLDKSSGKDIENKLNELKLNHGIPNTHIVADSDGLGNYLESYIKNIKTFHGGASAIHKKEYANLKAECAWKLAEYINKGLLKIICSQAQKEQIIKEITICLKRDNTDADTTKKRLIKKEEMKKMLGHSPDYLDMLIMRMYFDIKRSSHAG